MSIAIIIVLFPFLSICSGQSHFIGVNKIEGIHLPNEGEDSIQSCDNDNHLIEYPLPGELFGASGAFFQDHVMVCGGISSGSGSINDKCFSWFGDGSDWISLPGSDLLWPVFRPGYAKFVDSNGEEFLWIVGGNTGLTSTQVFHFTESGRWTVGADLPLPLYGQCLVQLNATHVLLTGGDQHGRAQNMVYDWDKGVFAKVGDFVGGERFLHGCAKMADGRVMVAAGYQGATDTQEAHDLDTVEIFDPVTETWSEGPKLAAGLDGNALVGINYGAWTGDVLHMGGHIPDSLNGGEPIPVDTVYRYKHEDDQWELLEYKMLKPRAHFNVIPIEFECPTRN